jgi:hypothetical protein
MSQRTKTKPLKRDRDHPSLSLGGLCLDEEDNRRTRKKGKSASGEVDGPMDVPKATIFEEVAVAVEDLPEFEPVHPGQPHVEWDDEEDYEMAEERFESLVDELFSDFEDEEAMADFEEVMSALGWSDGEVIWEGMNFDQMFSDSGQFHDFELLSRKDQRKFLREHLRTQQASGAAEASDEGGVEMRMDLRPKAKRAKSVTKPTEPRSPGQLVSYETETEHRPQELDIGMNTNRSKRRKRN